MSWFIETCVLTDERVAEFREACAALGISCAFTLDVDQPPEPRRTRPGDGANVIAYGSKSVMAYARRHAWNPGVWSGDEFDCARVQQRLGESFLNSEAALAPLASAEAVAASRGWDAFFIRPSNDDKSFAGMPTRVGDLPAWRSKMFEMGYLDDPNLEVIVAPPKRLYREWRLVVADGEVAASSLYRESGGRRVQEGAPSGVAALARAAAQRYRPAPVFVIDIAETDVGELAVVELNCFNSADLYACNIRDVVTRVSEAARKLE